MMNKYICILLSLSALLLQGCDQLQTPREATSGLEGEAGTAAAPAGPVLATVNGMAITQTVFDVYAAQRKANQSGKDDDNTQAILDELINLELMRQEGLNKGFDSKPEVVALLDQQHRAVLARAAMADYLTSNPVSDEFVKQFYDVQLATPTSEYNARHILVETREAADAIIKQLDEGADFAELAKEKSTGPSGASGGELGWFAPGQMVKPFSDAAATLEKGSYTKEPVQTQFGWHVILLEDTRESSPPPFDDVKDRLKIGLANKQLQDHIRQVRQEASIEITSE